MAPRPWPRPRSPGTCTGRQGQLRGCPKGASARGWARPPAAAAEIDKFRVGVGVPGISTGQPGPQVRPDEPTQSDGRCQQQHHQGPAQGAHEGRRAPEGAARRLDGHHGDVIVPAALVGQGDQGRRHVSSLFFRNTCRISASVHQVGQAVAAQQQAVAFAQQQALVGGRLGIVLVRPAAAGENQPGAARGCPGSAG